MTSIYHIDINYKYCLIEYNKLYLEYKIRNINVPKAVIFTLFLFPHADVANAMVFPFSNLQHCFLLISCFGTKYFHIKCLKYIGIIIYVHLLLLLHLHTEIFFHKKHIPPRCCLYEMVVMVTVYESLTQEI